MVAASFLATQPEDSVMIVWSDYEVSDHPLFNHGGGRLINRIWRPTVEAENTLLEGNLELLNARDERYWLQSDLCRLLVLYKYGGTWLDMDVILMNSFCPLYGIEYLYAWGGDLDFGRQGACGTVMSVNKGSYFGYQMLTSLANIEPRANTTCWGKELFAEVYRCESYRVLPCTFFNTEWCINLKG
jgi:hypothetical protein